MWPFSFLFKVARKTFIVLNILKSCMTNRSHCLICIRNQYSVEIRVKNAGSHFPVDYCQIHKNQLEISATHFLVAHLKINSCLV